MRTIITRILAVVFTLTMIITAQAAPVTTPDTQKTYSISMSGHVVESGKDCVTVFWNNPDSMAVDPDDKENMIPQYADLSVTKDTAITDGSNNPIRLKNLVPGQAVKATISFVVEREKLSENSTRYYKRYKVVGCQKIQLAGPVLKRKSTVKIGELEDNTMIGTVLAINDDSVDVYIEGGRIIGGGTEFLAQGRYDVYIESDSKFLDVNGNTMKKSSVKPFQRVLIKAYDHIFADGSYGYGCSSIASLKELEHGEKSISSGDIKSFHRMTATVVRKEKGAGGLWEYTVAPDKSRREAAHQKEYAVINMDYDFGPQPAFDGMDLAVGTHIAFNYTSINWSKAPGRLAECYDAEIIKDNPAEPGEEEAGFVGDFTPKDFISKDFNDIFFYGGVVYAPVDWANKEQIKIGNLLGSIKRTGLKADNDWKEFDATVLPVGTEIYKTSYGDMYAAKTGNSYKMYFGMREG